MGIETPVISGASRVGGFFLTPLGKINLLVTGILFVFLIISGIILSVEQNSLFPLFDNTVMKVVGADAQISQSVDILESSQRPLYSGNVFSKTFVEWLWFWIKFWFSIVTNIYFIYFVGWLLYASFQSISSVSQLRSIILAVISLIVLQVIAGVILYNMALSGRCLSSDKLQNFNDLVKNSYPFHGIIKLISHVFNRNLFIGVADWTTSTPLGQIVSNIPNSTMNVTL